jgi:hypothetical protein
MSLLAGSPPAKVKELQKQLSEANQKIAALESKLAQNDELTAYKVRMAVAEEQAKFHTVSKEAFQHGCEFAKNEDGFPGARRLMASSTQRAWQIASPAVL